MDRRETAVAAEALGLRPPGRGLEGALAGGWRSSWSGGGGGAFTTLRETEGEARETMPAVLPRRCSMSSFCCCLMESMERTCSIAAVSSRGMGRPITTGEIDLAASAAGVLTSVLIGCEMPLIVTRRFLLGEGFAVEGAGAAAASCGARWESWLGGGALRMVGEGRLSYSDSCLILTVLGERRSLTGVVEGIKTKKGGGQRGYSL